MIKDFIAEKLDGLRLDQCWDIHAHLLGVGDTPESGIYMNAPEKVSQKFFQKARLHVFKRYTNSLGYPTDETYLDHFINLAENVFDGFKVAAFAFTPYRDESGEAHYSLSDFVIPNEWSKKAVERSASLLYVPSIHPDDPEAKEKLRQAKADGAIAIKWLPCAHNINPSDIRHIGFYDTLRELDLPIITHAGSEHAVHGEQFNQNYGNPLHLRLPLDNGVKVIIAHCATDGMDDDIDTTKHHQVPSFILFYRLMGESAYEGLLYGDISATPQINRAKWLHMLLERQDWHNRLLNGSDYPLPALPALFSLRWLRTKGLLSERDVWRLNSIKNVNPLLFDFLLKRSLSFKGCKFGNEMFETRRVFDCWAK